MVSRSIERYDGFKLKQPAIRSLAVPDSPCKHETSKGNERIVLKFAIHIVSDRAPIE